MICGDPLVICDNHKDGDGGMLEFNFNTLSRLVRNCDDDEARLYGALDPIVIQVTLDRIYRQKKGT